MHGRGNSLLVISNLAQLSLEAHSQGAVADSKPIQSCNGHHGFLVLSHCYKAKPFTLMSLKVCDDLHRQHGPKWAKELPEHAIVRLWR